MKERLQLFLSREMLSPAKFADTIGVQRSSISHIITGRNNPGLEFIQKVLTVYPKINSEWLILGKGDMYKSYIQPSLFNDEVPSTPEVIKEPPLSSKTIEIKGIQQSQEEVQTVNEIPSDSTLDETKIPLANIQDIKKEPSEKPKNIVKIVMFYNDFTFEVFRPD